MRWQGRDASTNVEDRRGARLPGLPSLGGRRGAGVSCCGLILLLGIALVSLWLGVDPRQILSTGSEVIQVDDQESTAAGPTQDDPQSRFVAVVLRDTEKTWGEVFQQTGRTYEEPKLVLFDGRVASACGFASAAVGPFYCPGDQKVYLDLSFFRELDRRFGASGDFAQAYVVAHEVGHHVQNQLGISDQVHRLEQRARSQEQANQLSVLLELQADCLAGVHAHAIASDANYLEPGDIEEGLRAAAAVGDDTIQRRTSGQVAPESWTHGSAEMRTRWFRRGFESGTIEACDTFGSQ
jgi:predicted metalloprotease